MGRKKKNKNADFQKVKIKAGKRKPQSLNEDIPQFTAKKIRLNPLPDTSQNSKEMTKLLTNGNLNTSMKISYLEKLNKALANELKDGSNQAGEQIQALCKYLRDADKKVRAKAIECLKCCISIISSNGDEALNPVLHILFTHLNAGFTDMDVAIKEDCKGFFEFLLRRSDNSLNNHLMQIFIPKIEKCKGTKILEYRMYNLLNIFIRHRPDYFRPDKGQNKDANSDAKNNDDSSKTYVVGVPGELLAVPLMSPARLAERFQNLQDFSFTAALNPTMNLKDQFLELTKEMIQRDMKQLACKRSEREANLNEDKLLNFAKLIAKTLDIKD